MSSLLKNEKDGHEHSSHPMSSLLKNESGTREHSSYLCQSRQKMRQMLVSIVPSMCQAR